jgi:uncharacterized protein (TIGR00730 family)
MVAVKRLCVYCGSSSGTGDTYRAAARELGTRMAAEGIELVYGGGRVGLMGMLADSVLAGGGRVIGIIPGHLHDYEVGHHGVSELVVVPNMHERKRRMFERSDAFAVLPGGLGTLDETFEIITWKQLSLHDKPIVVVDAAGYWAPFQALVEHIVAHGFAGAGAFGLYDVVPTVDRLFEVLERARPPAIGSEPRLM